MENVDDVEHQVVRGPPFFFLDSTQGERRGHPRWITNGDKLATFDRCAVPVRRRLTVRQVDNITLMFWKSLEGGRRRW